MKNVSLCRWDPATRLLVSGPDASVFLQGQFTNDLRRSGDHAATYGLWLNQKGRVLADSFILAHAADRFEVVSLTSAAAEIRPRLEAYVIADDVTVEDVTGGTMGWVVTGAGAAVWLREAGIKPPEVGRFALMSGARVFRARAGGESNWFLFGSAEGAETVAALVASARMLLAPAEELAARRIEAGVPEIPTELGPEDLPNEGGLEHEAISFTKGCYLGQEVMARLHNLGQVRRRLFVVRASTEGLPPAARASLFVGEKRVGDVRRFVVGANGGVGLAMLHTNHVKPGDALALAPAAAPTVVVERLAEGRAW